jgi:hypothetical protein
MLEEFLGKPVVVDLRSHYVCLGILERIDAMYLEMRDADLHDLRDTGTSRENYVVGAIASGIKRNRTRVVLARAEVVAISRQEDVVDE